LVDGSQVLVGTYRIRLDPVPDIDLSMAGWADVAQYAFAITGMAALGFAYVEIRGARAAARRQRVYDYADTFNQLDMLRASARHRDQWPKWTHEEFDAVPIEARAEWMRLPNLIEEVAYLYNQKALDLDVASELLGVYIEKLWESSEGLVRELRASLENPRIFVDWERMQNDTWRRRGAPGPYGRPVSAPPAELEPFSRVRWIFSAEYRRDKP